MGERWERGGKGAEMWERGGEGVEARAEARVEARAEARAERKRSERGERRRKTVRYDTCCIVSYCLRSSIPVLPSPL